MIIITNTFQRNKDVRILAKGGGLFLKAPLSCGDLITLIIHICTPLGKKHIPLMHKYAGICIESFLKDISETGGA